MLQNNPVDEEKTDRQLDRVVVNLDYNGTIRAFVGFF